MFSAEYPMLYRMVDYFKVGSGRRPLFFIGIFFVFAFYVLAFGKQAFQPRVINLDFVAFYCAGEVANEGGNPYLTEPLRSCEHRVGVSFRKGSVVALPAPLPAYDIGFFRLMALIPFQVACVIWSSSLFLAVGLIIWLIKRAVKLEFVIVFCALVLSLGYVSVYLGQILPLSLLGIVLLSEGVELDSFVLVTLGGMMAMIEPHLAVAGLLACFFSRSKRTIFGVLSAGFLLGIISFFSLPMIETFQYFKDVLPAHALSEINNREQFSTAYYLHVFGLSESASVHVSELLFFMMVIASAIMSVRMSKIFGKRMLIFGPTAFSVVFGPFLHVTQMVAAIPACLLGYARRRDYLSGWCVVGLAIPWLGFQSVVVCAPLVVFIFATLGSRLISLRTSISLAIPFLGILFCGCVAAFLGSEPTHVLRSTVAVGSSLAEVSWREVVDISDSGQFWIFFLAKFPMHASVVALVSYISVLCLNRSSFVKISTTP